MKPTGEWGTGNGEGGTGEVAGLVTLTVAANGKISGKMIDADGTWTLSAASFDGVRLARDGSPHLDPEHQDPETGSPMSDVESPAFVATVIGKNGKKAITNEVTVALDEAACAARPPYQRGVVSGWAASEPPAAAAGDSRPPPCPPRAACSRLASGGVGNAARPGSGTT